MHYFEIAKQYPLATVKIVLVERMKPLTDKVKKNGNKSLFRF